MKTKGKLFYKKEWYSICSLHKKPIPDCIMCNSGQWYNLLKRKIEICIYKFFPKLWRIIN